jgi:hypothetical protein
MSIPDDTPARVYHKPHPGPHKEVEPMKTVTRMMTLAVLFFVGLAPSLGLACEGAGPNTHVGVVTALDAGKHTLSLQDAETGKVLTFTATPDLLKGIAVRDEVQVVYAPEGKTLRATAIKKG